MNTFVKSVFVVLVTFDVLCGVCLGMEPIRRIKVNGPMRVELQHTDQGVKVILDDGKDALTSGYAKIELDVLVIAPREDRALHKICICIDTATLDGIFLDNKVVLTCLSPIKIADLLEVHVWNSSTLYCKQVIQGKQLLIVLYNGGELFIDQLACANLSVQLFEWSNASIHSVNENCDVNGELHNSSCLTLSGQVADAAVTVDDKNYSIYKVIKD